MNISPPPIRENISALAGLLNLPWIKWVTSISQFCRIAPAQIPSGIVDGVNVSYSITHQPNPPNGGISYFVNGLHQIEGVHFSINGSIITRTTPLNIGDTHAIAPYFY